jgi:transposase
LVTDEDACFPWDTGGMYTVEVYARVRRAVLMEGQSRRAVARILGDGERQKTRAFSELQSYYLFAEKFGRPAKGNDKDKVENLVGYARRNFMLPIPHASSWENLNAGFAADCRQRRERRLRGHTETIAERFERDRAAMLPSATLLMNPEATL